MLFTLILGVDFTTVPALGAPRLMITMTLFWLLMQLEQQGSSYILMGNKANKAIPGYRYIYKDARYWCNHLSSGLFCYNLEYLGRCSCYDSKIYNSVKEALKAARDHIDGK